MLQIVGALILLIAGFAILQMIKTSLQLMEKRSGTLMTRVVARERFTLLVCSQ